ncbi:carbamoyltransferase HypF [Candidatus Woesearchaeota archaeon]|nr:carbamoyltransferase HypF [Candidatus Woesearchaeota archaeon]
MYLFFVKGTVQGVGFRPYIYRKAKENNLVGYVKNVGNGVEVLINDPEFVNKLTDLPPLAKITDHITRRIKADRVYTDFKILESSASEGETQLPPDIFMCKDCLKELRESKNRRNNYYFITCTNCGPRFSMITDYPYDRPFTSMSEFKMCAKCLEEYSNPLDRRYHAQTIACKDCGPRLILLETNKGINKDITEDSDIGTIKKAVSLIQSGEFISIKGVGGFHICALADYRIVQEVRTFLKRPNKPFAVMVKDLDMLHEIAYVSEKEAELLHSPQRPIVVLKKKNRNSLHSISELDTIGVMLPYTPLHYLIFDYINRPLLMTSCNIPGTPVEIEESLGKYFLTHERKIVNRCDDSVLKVIDDKTFYLRRSRGYTPLPVGLPINCKDTIAVGAELNNVICTAKSNKCYLSQYVGQTYKLETFNYLKATVEKFVKLSRLKPKTIACDLHPTYNSSIYAQGLARKYNAKLIRIQHHKAHVASVAAEHNLKDYVGIAMDGLGYGEDGKIWGGEIFDVNEGVNFRRIGHLEEQPQLGGDSAALYPKKMLFGILSKILNKKALIELRLFEEKEAALYLKILKENFNTHYTTSAGRILDAVAALLGLCEIRTYDGRPPMILESTATEPLELDPVLKRAKGKTILMTTPLVKFLIKNLHKDKGRLAATAQTYLARGMLEIAKSAGKPIVFSGGVAYNRMISSYMMKNGVLVNKEIPSGDGGICYGQAYLANLL